ncbi:MAG: hypothetical protein ACYC5Y_16060 [Symbiobacteriia bacterium]
MPRTRSPWPKRTMVANTDLNRFRYEVGGEPGQGQDGNDAVVQNPRRSAFNQQKGNQRDSRRDSRQQGNWRPE